MGGSSGQSARIAPRGPDYGSGGLQSLAAAQADPRIAELLAAYGSGRLGYNDALSQAGGLGGPSGDTSAVDKELSDIESQMGRFRSVFNTGQSDDQLAARLTGQSQQDFQDLLQRRAEAQTKKQGLGQLTGTAALDALATGVGTGNKLASEQVLSDPLYTGLFGEKGLSGQAQRNYGKYTGDIAADREALMGRDESYGLKESDLAAYGQASDQIARLFGAQEQSLAQAMSDRGLGAAPSGVSSQGFSNLYGNKTEQLKNAQFQIAQNRINTAKDLASTRMNASLQAQNQAGQLGLGLGNLARGAQGQAYGQNLAGIASRRGDLKTAADLALSQQAQNQDILNEQFAQRQATRDPSLGEAMEGGFKSGVSSGIGNLASSSISDMNPSRNPLVRSFLKAKTGGALGG